MQNQHFRGWTTQLSTKCIDYSEESHRPRTHWRFYFTTGNNFITKKIRISFVTGFLAWLHIVFVS